MVVSASVRLYDQRWCFVVFCGPIEAALSAEIAKRGYIVQSADADRALFSTETRVRLQIDTGGSPSSDAAITRAIADATVAATGSAAIAIGINRDVGLPGVSPEEIATCAGSPAECVIQSVSPLTWLVVGLAIWIVVTRK